MVMFYFSGTGNSEYIARKFSERMEIVCHSIEENIDFGKLLSQTDTLVDRKSTRLNSSHSGESRMPSSA